MTRMETKCELLLKRLVLYEDKDAESMLMKERELRTERKES